MVYARSRWARRLRKRPRRPGGRPRRFWRSKKRGLWRPASQTTPYVWLGQTAPPWLLRLYDRCGQLSFAGCRRRAAVSDFLSQESIKNLFGFLMDSFVGSIAKNQ